MHTNSNKNKYSINNIFVYKLLHKDHEVQTHLTKKKKRRMTYCSLKMRMTFWEPPLRPPLSDMGELALLKYAKKDRNISLAGERSQKNHTQIQDSHQ